MNAYTQQHRWMDECAIHQKRRDQCIPTVSVVCGPLAHCNQVWEAYAESTGQPIIRFYEASCRHLTDQWLAVMKHQTPLFERLLAYIAGKASVEVHSLRFGLLHRSSDEQKLYLQALFKTFETTPEDERILHLLCNLSANTTGENEADHELSSLDENALLTLLFHIHRSNLPILLFISRDESISFQESASAFLSQTAERFPRLTLGWSLRQAAWHEYMQHGQENRAKAVCRETVLELNPPDRTKWQHQLNAMLLQTPTIAPSVDWLKRENAGPDAVSEFQRALESINAEEDEDHARSHAERFLFTCLQNHPKTTGVFAQNVKVPIPFGNRSCMEIDLFSKEHRLALEIDGYYHFQTDAGYRRDRHKDFLLQKHGYLVMRFLAADVVERLEAVLNQIMDYLHEHQATHSPIGKDQ